MGIQGETMRRLAIHVVGRSIDVFLGVVWCLAITHQLCQHCRHSLMVRAKTLEKTLVSLRQSSANVFAPNMVKSLSVYLICFCTKHGIRTDLLFFHQTGMLF